MNRLLLIFPEVRSSLMTQTPRIESLCISVLTSYSNIPRILLSLSGHLSSSASIQKLFCGSCSTCRGSFDVFVGEKSGIPILFLYHFGTCPKGTSKRKVNNNTFLPQEQTKISNKQPKVTPKTTRERKNKQNLKLMEGKKS